jgi:hypothetical protein
MNERMLFDSIGQVDDTLLLLCDSKPKPKTWIRVIKHVATFLLILNGVAGVVLLTVPAARAWFDQIQMEEPRDYIQLPPELTTWSEVSSDGSSIGPVGIVRNNEMYLLTQEEYHAIMLEGADADEILAQRDEWASQWKDYQVPTP